jgi:CubicO group peptidase (beta-lactamase class C family)
MLVGMAVAACETPWRQAFAAQVNEVDVAPVNSSPDKLHDGWPVSTLEAEGIDPTRIAALLKRIDDGDYVGINGLVLVRNGKLVSEMYFGEYQSRPGGITKPYERDVLHQTRSTFKSVTGLLAGIAIDEGILGLDDPVMPYISDYHKMLDPDPRKQRITVGNLLEMSSGLDCSEMPGAIPQRETGLRNNVDMVRSHAELRMADEPGTVWRYCSSNPMLFGFALEAALTRGGHGSLKNFVDTRLMALLDISEYRTGYSPKGHMFMHGGQKFRPRDLAKFGQLVVSGGLWLGQRVVPAGWVESIRSDGRSTDWSWTDSVSSDPVMRRGSRYRYLWFQTPLRVGDRDLKLVHSWGNGGQFVIAVPALDLVVTITGANYGAGKVEEQKQVFHMLHQFILPAVR